MDTTHSPTTKFRANISAIREMSQTTLEMSEYEYETESGTKKSVQFKTTVPKSLVEAMGWNEGDKVDWSVESGTKLSVEKADE